MPIPLHNHEHDSMEAMERGRRDMVRRTYFGAKIMKIFPENGLYV